MWMNDRFERLRRVLAALKQADMIRLGAKIAEADSARARARAFRTHSQSLPAADYAADMVLQDHWQGHLEQRARHADAQALAFDAEADAMRPALARTFGREKVVNGLIDRQRLDENKQRERRAEDQAAGGRRPRST